MRRASWRSRSSFSSERSAVRVEEREFHVSVSSGGACVGRVSRVADGVYTSTEFPPHLEIGLHNELSYATWWPERLLFFCRVPATAGGETHIADGRRVLAEINEAVRKRFADKGVTYLQHLRDADH